MAGTKQTVKNLRRVQLNGEIFEEGMLESIVDTGRKNQVFVQTLGDMMQRKQATSATTEPEAAGGASSRMVS